MGAWEDPLGCLSSHGFPCVQGFMRSKANISHQYVQPYSILRTMVLLKHSLAWGKLLPKIVLNTVVKSPLIEYDFQA